ncbi:hypothetical protein [Methyloversatilis discipulorum]|uniref:hypothetical protein n=1 Tax=Methyloversatilis discipulorum TaxID=1119528 RepID=UPI0026EA6834|nr:hypothetical protein [Methyloversatilis discipulorum]
MSVAALTVVGFRYVTSVHEPEESFVAEQWVTRRAQLQLNDPGCVRGGMALSLIRTGALLKLTRVEVVGLLGAPDEGAAEALRYGLGQCHWDWRQSLLVIRFGPTGRTSSVGIMKE